MYYKPYAIVNRDRDMYYKPYAIVNHDKDIIGITNPML